MAITRYDPFARLNQLQRELNQLFERTLPAMEEEGSPVIASEWMPAVDIREESDRYIIAMDLPGINPNDVEINMENGVLSVKGERKFEKEDKQENYRRVERARGVFFRRFVLPDMADAEKISASYKDGVLEVVIPKSEKAQPKKIPIKA
jgi:HSP20 family protein